MENKKCAERRRALDQWKREAAAAEEMQRAAEQLQLLQTEAEVKAIQEHAMLFYSHNAPAQLAAEYAGTTAGSSSSSVTRPLPPRSTTPPIAPFGYPPGAYEMMAPAGRFLYPPQNGSMEVGKSMMGPLPSSIDLNRAPATHSKAPRPMPAAAMAGARTPCSTKCRVSVRRYLCRQRPRCMPLCLTRQRCRPPWHLCRPSRLPR